MLPSSWIWPHKNSNNPTYLSNSNKTSMLKRLMVTLMVILIGLKRVLLLLSRTKVLAVLAGLSLLSELLNLLWSWTVKTRTSIWLNKNWSTVLLLPSTKMKVATVVGWTLLSTTLLMKRSLKPRTTSTLLETASARIPHLLKRSLSLDTRTFLKVTASLS